MRRRDLLILAGMVGIAGGWQMFGVRPPKLSFSPITAAPGWEFAQVGGVSSLSGTDLITIGLDSGPPPLPAAQLWDALHHSPAAGAVPVAVFSDFFCPYCRVVFSRLANRSTGPEISLTWHELPLLRPGSHLVARAAEAASLQGGYVAFTQALQREGFKPTPRWMVEVAARAGLDADRLAHDMDSEAIAARLITSTRAARSLGIVGTPGVIIGRKAVLGALSAEDMEELIAQTA